MATTAHRISGVPAIVDFRAAVAGLGILDALVLANGVSSKRAHPELIMFVAHPAVMFRHPLPLCVRGQSMSRVPIRQLPDAGDLRQPLRSAGSLPIGSPGMSVHHHRFRSAAMSSPPS